MFISHEKKFVFFHLYKTAGTSITHVLNEELEGLGVNTLSHDAHINVAKFKNMEFDGKSGSEMLSDYFTFAFVRNPWDWQTSIHSFGVATGHPMYDSNPELRNFDHYIESITTQNQQYQFLSDNGDLESPVSLNFVGKFEHLLTDFQKICDIIKISGSLQHANITGHPYYTEYYNDRTKELLRKAHTTDIDYFGYNFHNENIVSGEKVYKKS